MSKNRNQEKKNSKNKKKHRILKAFLVIILILIALIGGFVGYSVYKNGWGVKSLIQTAMGQSEKKLQNLEPFTVLLLGVSEDISSKLSDTIIVASYNPKTQKATLLSIPRDTFIGTNKNKANSYDKINALYQKNPEKTLNAVNKITGLNIKYYAVISNNALVEVVDTIGGVEFDVPIDMNYDDSSQKLSIHLKKGMQKLNGEQAEGLVRFRHNNNNTSYPSSYGDNDLGRMRTQREFLKEVAKQTIKLKNITKIGSFVDILKENVTTNITNWSLIKDYIPYAIDFNTENLEMANIPGTTGSLGPNNLSFFIYDKSATEKMIKELFEKQNGTGNVGESNSSTSNTTTSSKNTENAKIKIEILNGSGDSVLLTKATKALKNEGYNVYKTGTTTPTAKTAIVNKTAVPVKITDEIKDLLGVGAISSNTTSSSTVDVRVVLGKDYK